jgi:DNA-binding transcriptional regulator YiaG
MIMAKSYQLLRQKMSEDARKKAEAKTEELLKEMPLHELRQARALSQQEIGKALNVNQSAVSKMERRSDMYISTLRKVIKAMGGELEIIARFPDGEVKVNQFGET